MADPATVSGSWPRNVWAGSNSVCGSLIDFLASPAPCGDAVWQLSALERQLSGQRFQQRSRAQRLVTAGVLPGDEIGDACLGQFGDLCADAGLVADHSHVARRGRAFAVEHRAVGGKI